MDNSYLLNLLTEYGHFGYLVLFFGMIVEGEFILLAAGFVASLGILNMPLVVLVAGVGVIVGDICWFIAGRKVGPRFFDLADRFFIFNKKRIQYIREHFDGSGAKTIFISKFLWNLSHLTAALAGSVQMKFRRFLKADAAGAIIWTLIISMLGYLFGKSFDLLKEYTMDITISLTIVALVVLMIHLFLRGGARKEIVKEEEEQLKIAGKQLSFKDAIRSKRLRE